MATNPRDPREMQSLNANREPRTITNIVATVCALGVIGGLCLLINSSLKSSGFSIYDIFRSPPPLSETKRSSTANYDLLNAHLRNDINYNTTNKPTFAPGQ